MRFLVVDVDSVFRRKWEALGDAAPGDAARAALTQIMGAREGYERIVLCGDKGRSFRVLAEPEYKGNRIDPGEAYREQRKALVAEVIRATGATAWASPPIGADEAGKDLYGEADDVIASFCLWYDDRRTEGAEGFDGVRILTGDTDLWALVDDSLGIAVRTLDGKDVGADQVFDRFGVAPHLVSEVKALAGDGTDHYDPFAHPEKKANGSRMPGIGEKTAAAIVSAQHDDADYSGADAVLRAAVAGADPIGLKLTANVMLCLRHGGQVALNRGRACARLNPLLRREPSDETWHPIDFAKVLEEPRFRDREQPRDPPAATPEASGGEPPVTSAALVVPAGSARAQSMSRSGLDPYALEPTALDAAMDFAHEVFKSRMYPNMPNEAAVLTLMCRARCLGIPAALAGDYFDYATIKGVGRPIWRAQGMLALVKRHHTCRQFEFDWPHCNDEQAVLLFQRVGERANRVVFTIQQAERAGWTGKDGPWRTRPGVMLRWAVVREVCRATWPDVMGSLYTRDELEAGTSDELSDE